MIQPDAETDGFEFRVLGPFEVREGGQSLPLPRPRAQAVLVVLLLNANRLVPAECLMDELWPAGPPTSARSALQVHVSAARRSLPAGAAVHTRAPGYVLEIPADAVDAVRFERLVSGPVTAVTETDASTAARLRAALGLWRGRALSGFDELPCARAEAARLEELRLVALEHRIGAELALGRHAELIGELRGLADAHPFRERLHDLLMLALYRAGRQADALEAYRTARQAFVDQLGIEPGPALRARESAILRQDATLAPIAAVAAVGHSLPPPATPTVGRETDVAEIVMALRGAKLVTLTGPGGVGKTRLALEAARVLEPDLRDGAWLIELAPIASPNDVAAAIAQGVGATLETGETPEAACKRFLASQQGLLVVDNFEHVLPAAPLLSRLLAAAPGLAVLATSREPLDLEGEHRCAIAPLDVPDTDPRGIDELDATAATALFLARARQRDPARRWPDDEAPAVAEICRRLDGLPLAIELAVGRLAVLSPGALAARLDDALTTLGHGRRDAPARQRTLRATLDWSHNLLNAHEQQVFAGFAVFAGGATVESASEVLQTDLDLLESLVAKHLLVHRRRANRDRLEMLETVRQYAHDRLADRQDCDTLRDRHARHYLNQAEAETPGLRTRARRDTLTRLTAELDNFRRALTFALESGDQRLAVRLTGALGDYWWASHRDTEGLRWADAALAGELDGVPDLELAHAWFWRAQHVLRAHDDMAENASGLNRALALYRRCGEDADVARCLSNLGLHLLSAEGPRGERRAEILRMASEALARARASGDAYAVARATYLRALTEDYPECLDTVRDAARRFDELGCDDDVAATLSDAAFNALVAGAYEDAKALLAEALPAAQAGLNPHRQALVLSNLGLTDLLLGEYGAAQRAFADCLRICLRERIGFLIFEPLLGCAAIAAATARPIQAGRLFGASRALRINAPDNEIDQVLEQRFLAPARAMFGNVDWDCAVQAGDRLDFEAAIGEALATLETPSLITS